MNFDKPAFEHSHLSNLIQLADTATYIYHNAHPRHSNHTHKPLFTKLRSKYIDKMTYKYAVFIGTELMQMSDRRLKMVQAFNIEMLFMHIGGMEKTLPQRKKTAFSLIEKFLDDNGKGPGRKRPGPL